MSHESIIYYTKQLHPIRSYDQYEWLKPFTVHIHQGEWITLIGKNGSGKSTLARMISGLMRNGLELYGKEGRPGQHLFPIVTQMTSDYLLGSTPYEDLIISYEQYGIPIEREQLENRIDELLHSLQLFSLKHVPIEQLSGGERQLVAFAGALLMDSPCIIFDEITSMLSDSNKWLVCSFIREMARAHGIAVIWVTQQSDELEASDTVWIMDQLTICFRGKAYELFIDHAGYEGTSPAKLYRLSTPWSVSKSLELGLAPEEIEFNPYSLAKAVMQRGSRTK